MISVATPLSGQTVLVTRPKEQAGELTRRLEALGAQVFELPALEVAPTGDPDRLDQALRELPTYDWLVLTSVNGVRVVAARLDELGKPARFGGKPRLAAIGPATAAAAEELWGQADFIPYEFEGEALARQLPVAAGERVLLARADLARKDMAEILRQRNVQVDEVEAYRLTNSSADQPLPASAPDVITFTSSASVRAIHACLAAAGKEGWLRSAKLVCIGPITARTVEDLGFEVAARAREYTIPGLVEALLETASNG